MSRSGDRRVRPASLILGIGLAIFGASDAWAQGLEVELVEVATGLDQPLLVTHAGDGSGRLFLVERGGRILIHDGSQVLGTPFLDLSGQVSTDGGEQGLLGLAFHPAYHADDRFFVNYTDTNGNTVVARYRVSAGDPNVADATSDEILLTLDQPFANHNGGHLAFGPDGYLHIASGDGGGGGDPGENAQDLGTLLGKLLRIDVDTTEPGLDYGVPPDNPFVGDGDPEGTRDEIWAYGLRNPWRFSFDRQTGDLYVGDVGQNQWEEIDFEPVTSVGGGNYGWDVLEGAHCFEDEPAGSCADFLNGGSVLPVLEYCHDSAVCSATGCSVTGGFVYRGDSEPRLRGVYLFADFCNGRIRGTVPWCDGGWELRELLDSPLTVSSFGEDEAGEVYLTHYSSTEGSIHRVVLSATSDGPDLELAPASHDFGQVEVGDTVEVDLTLTNANPGPEAVFLSDLALVGGTEFELDVGGGSSPCGSSPCLSPRRQLYRRRLLQGVEHRHRHLRSRSHGELRARDGSFQRRGRGVLEPGHDRAHRRQHRER